jgi:serine phosphatase RsbU (regulator of sigma subunit)
MEGITELYMYSDGFQDQFNAENTKKFGSKKLLELIRSSRNSGSLEAQKNVISQTLSDWKRDVEQVDDITLIGISL